MPGTILCTGPLFYRMCSGIYTNPRPHARKCLRRRRQNIEVSLPRTVCTVRRERRANFSICKAFVGGGRKVAGSRGVVVGLRAMFSIVPLAEKELQHLQQLGCT